MIMSTRSKILLINLLLLLAYSIFFAIGAIRYPPQGHSMVDHTAATAFFILCHSGVLLFLNIIDRKREKDWLLALLMVLVVGFSTCLGSGQMVSSGRFKQYEVPRDSIGNFIE